MFPALFVNCLLLFVIPRNLASTSVNTFQYYKETYPPFFDDDTRLSHLNQPTCKTCLDNQCLVISDAICGYYSETSKILADDDDDLGEEVVDDEVKGFVDETLSEVMDLASSDNQLKECIPLISKKTDCTKENICTGCNTCQCGSGGSWICSRVQKCRSDTWRIDHVVLDYVINTLEKADLCLMPNNNEEVLERNRSSIPQIIYKRDTTAVNKTIAEAASSNNNNTESTEEFKQHVLQPIANIIEEKRNEINELIKIKDNLINLIKTCKNKELDLNISTSPNHSQVYFSIYKLEFEPHRDILRTDDENILTKYLKKLKADIHSVLRDVLAIHKITKEKPPKHLKMLIRALRYYLVKNLKDGVKSIENKTLNTRRTNDNIKITDTNACYIKDNVLKIFLALNNATNPNIGMLTPKEKKIVKRVIDQTYIDNFANYNPIVNLSMIENFGKDIDKIDSIQIYDKLYVMKILHLKLTKTVSIMNDMLARVNFALFRRMDYVDQTENIEALTIVESKLNRIQEKIKNIESSPKKIKKPFLTRLKNFFKKSKHGLERLFRKKHLKVSKLNSTVNDKDMELKEAFEAFIKQDTSEAPREKRAISRDRFRSRMKNILPKYLRRKMNPAIEESVIKRKNRYMALRKEKDLMEGKDNLIERKTEPKKLSVETPVKDVKNPKINDSVDLHTRLVFIKNK